MFDNETDDNEVDTEVGDEEFTISPYKDFVEQEDFVEGINPNTYNHIISNENLTPEEREKTIRRNQSRIYSSVAGLNFTNGYDASPRLQMFCSHNTQRLVFKGMTPKNIINGVEQEFGKFNFKIEVQENCIIHEVIKLYQPRLTDASINYNPKTYVIVQYTDRPNPGCFGVIVIENYCSMHQHFGYVYKDGKDLHKVVKHGRLSKGDILKEAPSITDNGDMMFGRELKTIMMTHKSVAEDGIAICEDVLEHFAFDMFEERTVGFGKKTIPLNIYGDETKYKICPDIGEFVRSDDILFATREIDENVAIACQNKWSTQIIDHVFDESIFVVGGGQVVNLQVICNNESENRFSDMESQLLKYHNQSTEFYKKIIAIDKKFRHDFQNSYEPSNEFRDLIIEALVATNINGTVKISKQYRRAPMDDFTVKFVVQKRVVPNLGFKFTDTRGRKGVCCAILPRDQMPRNKDGVSADIIVDPIACINRMTMGAPIECGINFIKDLVVNNIKEALGIDLNSPHFKREIKIMSEGHDPRFEKAWEHALNFYKDIATHSMYPKALSANQHDKATVISHAVKNTLGLYLPPENAVNFAQALNDLHEKHETVYERVTYKNSKGQLITSKDPMPIQDMYYLILEKIGDGRSAVSSVRFQIFGVPATISKHDRYISPVRWQAGKIHGESEARPFNGITRPSIQPEIIDRNNNPKTATICYEVLLRAPNPSKIEKLVDRKKHPFGFTMPIQILNHVTMCSGYRFVYKNDNPGLYKYSDMVKENM